MGCVRPPGQDRPPRPCAMYLPRLPFEFILRLMETRAAVVDAVIQNNEKVLLIERGSPPDRGKWAFPGGFIQKGYSAEQTVVKEVKEETGLDVEATKLMMVLSSPNRDPRGTVSLVFSCRLKEGATLTPQPGDDANKAEWFDINNLPKLAFDHNVIAKNFIS